MSKATEDAGRLDSPLSDQLGPTHNCSHCGFPLPKSTSGLRHYGTHTAHQESECLRLLQAEIERLRADADENNALRERLAGLLAGVALALRGPPPPLTLWSWHDLPDRAAAAIAAIDVMHRVAVMAAEHD